LLIRQILFRPRAAGESLSVSPNDSGFEHLNFQIRRLIAQERFSADTGRNELGIVVLGGICSVESPAGAWSRIGRRMNVFDGVGYTLYLPIQTQFTVVSEEDCEIALCYCAARKPYPARLITPAEVEIEIRGGGNATRQINHLLKPDFPAARQSSYPWGFAGRLEGATLDESLTKIDKSYEEETNHVHQDLEKL
jgi:5-deoxy-glucuronate isomerase